MPPTGPAAVPKLLLLPLFLLVLTHTVPVRATEGAERIDLPVRELQLDNGMTFLLLPQPEATTVAAGWVVSAGSADDPRDQTGLSHLVEHLMFKGSRTVGTRDSEQEANLTARLDDLRSEQRQLEELQQSAPREQQKDLARRRSRLLTQIESLQQQIRQLSILGEFSLLYSEQGASGLDASTYEDMTLYYVTLPVEKLELWFWLESDRLLQPVFRELDKEVEVIYEERRMRIESAPTGLVAERSRRQFWGEHSYAWNPLGRDRELDGVSRDDAYAFFRRHYVPQRLTAALVGGFDVDRVTEWARTYFGRLPEGGDGAPATQLPPARPQAVEQRFEEACDCPPQVHILYPAAAFGDPDLYALQLLSGIMNGRAGRLYRQLVVEERVAFSAYTEEIPRRLAGEFAFRAETKGAVDPGQLIASWDRQIAQLLAQPPSQEELDRARNRLVADALRSLKEPGALMRQLLLYAGLGDWKHLVEWTDRVMTVTPRDVADAAAAYLRPERRTVVIYQRRTGS